MGDIMTRSEHWGTTGYSEGYFTAVAGSPATTDEASYVAGYEAGKEALETITSAGLVRAGSAQFTASLVFGPRIKTPLPRLRKQEARRGSEAAAGRSIVAGSVGPRRSGQRRRSPSPIARRQSQRNPPAPEVDQEP